ncbi:VCBS domain-containing protein, partial [Gilvimarinus xylanilyticus]|nr:VCBS domain-containing protein [Gilvimarinus xylanilyticus]
MIDQVAPQVIAVSESLSTGLDNSTLLSMLSVDAGAVIGSGDTQGVINWAFASGSEAFDFLPEGESLDLTYTVQVTDSAGATDTHEVVISLTGTDDTPIFRGDDTGEVTEDVDVDSAGELIATGALVVDDPDAGESVFDTGVVNGTDNETTTGALTIATDGSWRYSVENAEVQYLAVGETLTDTFTVSSDDGSEHTITVTVNGTNDAPVISVEDGDSDTASFVETDSGLSTTGTLTVGDVDLSDVDTATVTAVDVNLDGEYNEQTLLNMLSVNAAPVIEAGATTGVINWSFDSGNQAFDILPDGVVLDLTYTVQVIDSAGAIDTHEIVISITGTDDGAIITGGDTGEVTE